MKIFSSTDFMKCYYTICISVLFIAIKGTAQTNNPTTRFGMGEQLSTENIYNMGMGGVSLADNSPYIVNYNNPASYGSLALSTFQMAMRANRSRVSIGTSIVDSTSGGLDLHYVNFGLPIKKNAGISFGLMPISKVYYLLKTEEIPFDTTRIFTLSGSTGNYQNLYLGFGTKYKNFSAGAQVFYTFGTKNLRTVNTFDSLAILTAEYQKNATGGGIGATFGVQYAKELQKNRSIKFGATFSPGYTIKTKTDLRYISTWQNAEVDTALTVIGDTGRLYMPTSYAAGFMARLNNKITVGADYNAKNWSSFTENGNADSLQNTNRLSFGVNYIPDVNSANYWKHLEYRVGFYTGKEALFLQNTPNKINAFTLGLSLPMRRTRDGAGFLHAGIEVGSKGTVNNGLLKEGFTRFRLGLTMNAKWFTPRKYD